MGFSNINATDLLNINVNRRKRAVCNVMLDEARDDHKTTIQDDNKTENLHNRYRKSHVFLRIEWKRL